MKDFTARFAGLAMLTLAAVPLAAGAASVAQAAPAATIRVADLDMSTAQGRAAFEHRATRAAHVVCRSSTKISLNEDAACEAAVKVEARDKLAAVEQARLARSQSYAAR